MRLVERNAQACRPGAQDLLDQAETRGAIPLAVGDWLDLQALPENGKGDRAKAAAAGAAARTGAGSEPGVSWHLVVLDTAPVDAGAALAGALP